MGDSARLLPAAFASLLFASLFAAMRVPAMPYAVYVGFVCGIALVGPCPLLARFQSFGLVFVHLMMIGQAFPQCFFLEISCFNEMHGCWHGAAMMASAAALPYLSLKLVMQATAAVPPAAANVENNVPASLFVVDGIFTTALLLASAALASVGINMKRKWHAVAASAAAPDDRNAHDCLFVSSSVFESFLLIKLAAAFVGISVKMFMRAVAAPAAAWGVLHVSEVLFAIAGLCHVIVICWNMTGLCHMIGICWNILDWPCCALGVLMLWKCDCQDALARFAPGSCKKQSDTFSKVKGSDSLLQASTQALTPEECW